MRGKVKAMARALAFSGLVLLGLAAIPKPVGADGYCIDTRTMCEYTHSCYECSWDPYQRKSVCHRYIYVAVWLC
jgi:hypothetical protein